MCGKNAMFLQTLLGKHCNVNYGKGYAFVPVYIGLSTVESAS